LTYASERGPDWADAVAARLVTDELKLIGNTIASALGDSR
jgi:hypothetical protein